MVSTYHGVETGSRALTYFRKSMEVSGINIAKVKEEGYSRQVVNSSPTQGLESAKNLSMLGTGVEIKSIERMRDLYLDARYLRAKIAQ